MLLARLLQLEEVREKPGVVSVTMMGQETGGEGGGVGGKGGVKGRGGGGEGGGGGGGGGTGGRGGEAQVRPLTYNVHL